MWERRGMWRIGGRAYKGRREGTNLKLFLHDLPLQVPLLGLAGIVAVKVILTNRLKIVCNGRERGEGERQILIFCLHICLSSFSRARLM